ncbi:hypothetical protein KC360_g4163 [Hortaea werneckii]|nr:hypothetical protein KC325_g4238 [Hortaea werneckii]KAI6993969.1 hypothetical protein KC359_g4867 [Hortaea werneckii]KAI7142494.1 hypothetical protein KC344_g7134 [Hortaea werneckii]KAI7174668.1 hypothetical protein KC360_g4163 [Hortaea werneckii]
MRVPVTHTQRLILERPRFGHIAKEYTIDCMRTWNPQGGYTDIPLRWPPTDPTPGQGNTEENGRDGEFADTGKVVVSIRRFKKLKKDHDATSGPNTVTLHNTDPPDRFFNEWMDQDPTLLRAVNRMIIRSDWINGLGGVNGRIYRYVVEMVPDPADAPNTALASAMGGLPVRPQLSQQAETWNSVSRPSPSMHGNPQTQPSGEGRTTRPRLEAPSFPQTVSSPAQMSGVPSQNPRSLAPDMRQNQQPELDQFGRPIMTYEDVHPANQSRPSIRRPRNPPPTTPMGTHRDGNGGDNRSGSRTCQPIAPGNVPSQMPPDSQRAMAQPRGPSSLRRDPQHTISPETIEIPSSSSSSSDDNELEERRKRRRIN